MNSFDKTYIIIPVFNEEKVIRKTISELKKYFNNIIVINDGSTDSTNIELDKLKIITINHPINLGQGASIKTGIEFVLNYTNAEAVITFDADGQHSVEDAKIFAKKIFETEKKIIFGSRFLKNENNIPFLKKIILKIAIYLTNLLFRVKLTDTHNGLKAFKIEALREIEINIEGYAFETEIIIDVSKKNISYMELPTNIIYTEYSKAKGQSVLNSIRIFEDIMIRLFKK